MTANHDNLEADRAHKQQLLAIYRSRLRQLELQAAKFGDAPSHVLFEMNECREKIDQLERESANLVPKDDRRTGGKLPVFISSKQHQPRIRVLIGSASPELEQHCKAVEEVIWRSDLVPFDKDTTTWSERLQLVDESDVFVGVVGVRYGDIPAEENDQGYSRLELEYRRAMQRRIPVLMYVASEEHRFSRRDYLFDDADARTKFDHFLTHLRTISSVREFDDVDRLREQLRQDLEDIVVHQLVNPLAAQAGSSGLEAVPRPPEPYYHPEYTLTRTFFGRRKELQLLEEWAASQDSTVVLEAIGGMGKSAIAWEWVHQYAPRSFRQTGVIWWSFYEPQATLKRFARHALAYITRQDPDDPALVKLSYDDLAARLTTALSRGRYLLVLDGLERILVAYWRIERAHLPDFSIADGATERDCAEIRDDEFLRQLVAVRSSKILICSRLLPLALEDLEKTGQTIRRVRRLRIEGLSPEDADDLIRDLGITQANPVILHTFLRQLGYHALLIKLIASHISRDFRRAPGNFDRWYEERGKSFDLASIASPDLPNHVLYHALAGLDDFERQLLIRLAAFSGPIDYTSLAAFFVPPRPPLPALPPRIRTRPHPFGSTEIARLRQELSAATTPEEEARILAAIDQQEASEAEWFDHVDRNRAQAEAEAERVRRERLRLIEQHEREYRTSREYLHALNELDAALRILEDRGLIEWDRQQNTYDLHPVVRSYAISMLPPEEQQKAYGYVLDHFAATPTVDEEAVREVHQLHSIIEMHRTLVRIGEFEEAAQVYNSYLRIPLMRLKVDTLIVELVEPLFEFSPTIVAKFQTGVHLLANTLGHAMLNIGRFEEAKHLYLLNLSDSVDGSNLWNLHVDISSYGNVLRNENKLAHAKKCSELAALVCPTTDKSYVSWDMARIGLLAGQWSDAQMAIEEGKQYGEPANYPQHWKARMAVVEAELYVFHGVGSEDVFQVGLNAAVDHPWEQQKLYRLAGIDALQRGDIDAALSHIQHALTIAARYDYPRVLEIGLMARIELARDHRQRAKEFIEQALRMVGRKLEDEAIIATDAAEVFLELGDTSRAKQYALRAYELAWADGPPNSRWWPLQRASAVLQKLEVPLPQLPVIDVDQPVLPLYEDKIQALVASLKQDESKHVVPNHESQDDNGIQFSEVHWLQIGTLATFGMPDRAIIERLAERLTLLSTEPTAIQVSYKGDDTPLLQVQPLDTEEIRFDELDLSYNEVRDLANVLVMAYIEGLAPDGERFFVYTSMLLHRFLMFAANLDSKTNVDLRKYNATIILSGSGTPPEKMCTFMFEKYLFGTHSLVVRIFP